MPRNQLLTAGQVAKRCGVHRTTVHHWEKDGKLEAAQVVNGIRLFDAAEVERFLNERTALAVDKFGACPTCSTDQAITWHNSDPCPDDPCDRRAS